jgi:hypothetical protein
LELGIGKGVLSYSFTSCCKAEGGLLDDGKKLYANIGSG